MNTHPGPVRPGGPPPPPVPLPPDPRPIRLSGRALDVVLLAAGLLAVTAALAVILPLTGP